VSSIMLFDLIYVGNTGKRTLGFAIYPV
jgi:hypothetical protein